MRLLLATLLAAAPALAERVAVLGPSKAQRDSSAAVLDYPFLARADEELTGAKVRLVFEADVTERPEALEVLVNDERIALLAGSEIGPGAIRELPVARGLLADRNTLTLRMADVRGRCVARSGGWAAVRSVAVALESQPVPLPDELALLPLPFFDRGFDTRATVPIALGHDPTSEDLRLAGIVAGWFAASAPIPLTFETQVGALPPTHAIAVVGSARDAAALGIEAPTAPLVRMTDHPRVRAAKLLVIGGATPAQLRIAVEALAVRSRQLAGPEVRLSPAPAEPSPPPWSAPRWLPTDRVVRFADFPEGGSLAHEGARPGTISVRVRLPPDLFIWPADAVTLDLGWTERLPQGAVPPRLDAEINGYFLATLPAGRPGGESRGRMRLRIPREHMRGFNELLVHVHYPDPDPCATAAAGAASGDPPRVSLDGDSVLHVEHLPHFARLPDASLFAFDGYPFTRKSDLSETVVVMPERPDPSELSMALSIVGQLAQVTGRVGTGATWVPAERIADTDLRDKDALVIGHAGDNPLIARWAQRLPVAVEGSSARVHRPQGAGAWLELLGGPGALIDERRAAAVVERHGQFAAILAIESPVSSGRSALVVTSSSATLPPFQEFLGYAQSREQGGDVLLLAGGERWMFRIGSSFGSGSLDPWTRVRWFFATHWMALVPLFLFGVAGLAREARIFTGRRMRARLAEGARA